MFEEAQVLTHSSIKITGNKILYFDPYKIEEERHDADIIFVTHDHFDHYSPEDIKKVTKDDTWLIMPAKMKEQAANVLTDFGKYKFINPDGLLEAKGLMIKAVPAYNRLKPFHTKGKKFVGYLVTMNDVNYYVAGDTDMIPENQRIKCDVAFVPVGGKYTMDYKEAAKFINQIEPKLAIPTHYGTVAGSPGDGKKFAELVDKKIEVRVMM
jgi:Predicted Zn-dependent hydrolases of the beta-lactamase fold